MKNRKLNFRFFYLLIIYAYTIFAIIINLFIKIIIAMYQSEKTIIIKGANINELWEAHSDIKNWPKWQADIAWTKVDSKIKKGTQFILKPKSGPKAKLEIITFDKPKEFTDVSYLPMAKMYTTTKMRETKDGVEIKLEIKMEGLLTFLWKNVIAKDIIKGHQKQNENMVNYIKSLKDF